MRTQDDLEKLGEYRDHLQRAISRARVTPDPMAKAAWTKLAENWSHALADFEASMDAPQPVRTDTVN
jgi:hypothetical protein